MLFYFKFDNLVKPDLIVFIPCMMYTNVLTNEFGKLF